MLMGLGHVSCSVEADGGAAGDVLTGARGELLRLVFGCGRYCVRICFGGLCAVGFGHEREREDIKRIVRNEVITSEMGWHEVD